MALPPLTDQTLALLAAITPDQGKQTTTHTDSLYELVEPIQSVIEAVAAKLAEVDRLRRAADRVEEGNYAFAFFERIRQTVDGAQRQAQDILGHVDRLTDILFQLDRYGMEMQRSLETHYERIAALDNHPDARMAITKSEYAKLREEAAQGRSAMEREAAR